ncbi:protein of unknown function DUF1256 [Alkaliphilus metalliredigens QYMF]|uniref:Sporulation protein YyaC n=1 Tax=Alkaliphilus metalliredigens (strain QYMF) TaxID=293826 RepID=A6TL70_ALKMQ|nr:spore protease YyaC [Alkaliphilus metalliredigens]ABR46938.1 protein of unknown function DUF1256 [Alkaliphilus metalliredigens QYMF]
MVSYHYKNPQMIPQFVRYLSLNLPDEFIVLCIGTDRCIGDALGPLVGSLLLQKHFPHLIYGTLGQPIHALNLKNTITMLKQKHPNAFILAIDASLGDSEQVGFITLRPGPIAPGKGVGKALPSVGDLSLIGIVAPNDEKINSTIHHIRLSLIMDLAQQITEVLMHHCHIAGDNKSTY